MTGIQKRQISAPKQGAENPPKSLHCEIVSCRVPMAQAIGLDLLCLEMGTRNRSETLRQVIDLTNKPEIREMLVKAQQ